MKKTPPKPPEEKTEQEIKKDEIVDFDNLTKQFEKLGVVAHPEDQEGYVEPTITEEEKDKLAKEIVEDSNKAIDKRDATLPLTEAEKQKSWENFIKQIKMYDIIEGLINRSLEYYAENYNKINPGEPVNFNLFLKNNKILKAGDIFDVSLVLTMGRGGKQYKLSEKNIKFKHIREFRNQVGWKFQLYQGMLDTLTTQALNFYIIKKDADAGRFKSVPRTSGDTEVVTEGKS